MPTYCTDTQLLRRLPPAASLGTSYDTSEERAAFITEASELVDCYLGNAFVTTTYSGSYQKFPDVTADEPTPKIIQYLTSLVAAWLIFTALGTVNRDGTSRADVVKREWQELVDDLREGRARVYDSTGTDYAASADEPNSNTDTYTPIMTVGGYDEDGTMLSSTEGSLDSLTE